MGVGIYAISKGNFNGVEAFVNSVRNKKYLAIMEEFGKRGVEALSKATPKDTGKTSESWSYKVEKYNSGKINGYRVSWVNSNVVKNVQIALILQYGHGTGTGGYVEGRDYINPAMRPVFDEMAQALQKGAYK